MWKGIMIIQCLVTWNKKIQFWKNSWDCQDTSEKTPVGVCKYIPLKYELYVKQSISNISQTIVSKAKC